MTFPKIRHINDVLPHVEGRPEFVVADKGDYTVIDYVFAIDDSFDDPIRGECRGIKFSPDGSVLARPLHKFFNVGERRETLPRMLDFSRPHTVLEKLDGTMIHPAIIDGEVVLMTRMGRTEHAQKAERHLTPSVREFCCGLLLGGATPIFEWTAPDNRIVVRYEKSALTLLAVRNTVDGSYWPHDAIVRTGMPCAPVFQSSYSTAADFIAFARAVVGKEGFVVRWDDGTMVKAKGEDYVLKHRAKDGILQEKNILALVLGGGLDDVLPLLDDADADAARRYRDDVMAGIRRTAAELCGFVAANDNLPQKDFATGPVQLLAPELRSLAFLVRRGMNADTAIRARLIARATSQSGVDECRTLHGARWCA
ncbi:RNA ligase [Consotaella salsifontis]|uniref:RNA ligase n=1 Tax=Consotaella salsifontis TaxID=1365950 RepID=A0A1T4RVI2_9HYPH|nr:RNA ligase [Consotaella salsifontis]SKA19983.1 RNA ligase [Consotaella salsifontis]